METTSGIGQRVAVNATVLLLTDILGKLLQVLFVMYAARALGVQRYGMYTLAGVFITFFGFKLGIPVMAVREIARNRAQAKTFVSNMLFVLLGITVLAYGLILLVVPLTNYQPEVKSLIYILALGLFPDALSLAFGTASFAFEDMKLPSFISMGSGLLSSFLGILVLFLGYGLIALAWTTVAVGVGNAVIAGWLLRRKFLETGLTIDPDLCGWLIKRSLPFAVLALLLLLHAKVDIFMLSALLGPVEGARAIGYYTPAYSVISALMMLPMHLRTAMVPVFASRQDSTEIVRSNLEGSTKFLLAFVGFPLIIITSFFAEEIVVLLFGEAYLPTAKALRILGPAYALYAATSPTFALLSTAERLWQYVPWVSGVVVLNIGLNFLLIPSYSFVGASVATLITETLAWLFRLYLVKRITGIEFSDVRVLLNLLVPAGITFTVVFFFYVVYSPYPWLLALMAGAVYLTGLIVTRVYRWQDFSLLKILLRQLLTLGYLAR